MPRQVQYQPPQGQYPPPQPRQPPPPRQPRQPSIMEIMLMNEFMDFGFDFNFGF